MGMVYRATSVESGLVYALKVLAPEVAGNEKYRQRFRREMRVAASLRHPNVVAVRDADEHDGLLFLTMDYIAGTDLEEELRQGGAIDARRGTELLAQVASGLDAAHARGLVHRDVKPGNILIAMSEGGEHAYVTDFGLAKRFDRDASMTALTKTGVVVGTVDYMSPEQITGGRTDGRADIYGLGCVYFEMLTGAVPYGRGNSLMATMYAHVHEPPPPLPSSLAERYPHLGAVIDRALAKDPDKRYFSAAEFASDAADALHGPRRKAAAPHQTRRMVTVLCCSVAPGSECDRQVVERSLAEIDAAITRHGGIVEMPVANEVVAVFGLSRAREDDAVRAVRAAAEIGERLLVLAAETGAAVRVSTGVDTGRVLVGGLQGFATGDPMDAAARLQMLAGAGEVLMTGETLRLVRSAVAITALKPVALKLGSDPVPVFKLEDLDPDAPGLSRRFDIPFVARERELRLLRDAWARAVEERGCHLVTVLGEAGVGKSRLVGELLDEVGDAGRVLRGRCLPYGEGITFWPLTEALTPLGDIAQPVINRLRGGGVAAPEELFLAVRQLLESIADERPTILHIDDLQWAEPMLLDLLDHVADVSRVAPILVLCATRLELLDLRPGWGGGKLNATTALLGPLGAADSERLLEELAAELDPDMRSKVLTASSGNPLFLEEMAALARDAGSVAVPATIDALLAERLERLAGEEREILECAAVEGEVFHRRAVESLIDERSAGTVESALASLVRKELIRPHTATPGAEGAFRFRHLLLRDAAYDALPEATRARLHERFARWFEDVCTDVAELDEIAGWHLEQAVRYGERLSRAVDPRLAPRAVAHLRTAGGRARNRGDLAAATSLLERALALASPEDGSSDPISVSLAECLVEAGDLGRADELLSAVELGVGADPLAALTRLEWTLRVRPQELVEAIESALPRILRELAATGDEGGMARAHLVAFMPHWLTSQWTLAGEQARLAAEHADRAGDQGERSRALAFYVGALIYGDSDVSTIARELDEIEAGDPGASLAARLKVARGQLARLQGRFVDALRFVDQALEGFQALGMRELEASCVGELGVVELSAGDAPAALSWLLRSDALLAELGQHGLRSTIQARVAQTHGVLNDLGSARKAVELAERLSAPEDILNFAITHRVRARLALSEGDAEGAIRWGRSAVAYAFRTDMPEVRADATLDLAGVLEAAGLREDAIPEARVALELFTAKGHRPGIERARAFLAELEAPA
jgi:tetratricopeptide (TPR) repeat protein